MCAMAFLHTSLVFSWKVSAVYIAHAASLAGLKAGDDAKAVEVRLDALVSLLFAIFVVLSSFLLLPGPGLTQIYTEMRSGYSLYVLPLFS